MGSPSFSSGASSWHWQRRTYTKALDSFLRLLGACANMETNAENTRGGTAHACRRRALMLVAADPCYMPATVTSQSVCRSVVSDSCDPTACSPSQAPPSWDSPGKSTRVQTSPLARIFPTRSSDTRLLRLLRWQAASSPLAPPASSVLGAGDFLKNIYVFIVLWPRWVCLTARACSGCGDWAPLWSLCVALSVQQLLLCPRVLQLSS